MSRVAHRTNPLFVPAAATLQVFLVPAAHKYELVDASVGGAGAAVTGYLLLTTAGGALQFIDEIPVGATGFGAHRQYGACVFNAGDKLSMIALPGGATITVSYIDVTG